MADNVQEQSLTPGAQRLVEAALAAQAESGQEELGVHHWLLALLDRHGPMAADLVQGLNPAALLAQVRQKLADGDAGPALDEPSAVSGALARARGRGKQLGNERDLAAIILTAAGHEAREPVWAPVKRQGASAAPQAPVETPTYHVRAQMPTPGLDFYGQDFTRLAAEGKLRPTVGRDAELALMVETLCRVTKRNPALVGPAGVGKTALVEGLAQKIVAGDVPPLLQGVRLIALQPSSLVAGLSSPGELEGRVKQVLAEASQDGILLFIDEFHTLVGAGGYMGTTDLANQIKPALARGDIACIAATTGEEYRRFIEADAALERRFQPLRVNEPGAEQTLQVLHSLRDQLAGLRNVTVGDDVLAWLVQFAEQYLRNRHFPDKAVDLLEQCVAHAAAHGKGEVAMADAESVAQRMVGMPQGMTDRLAQLGPALAERGLLAQAEIDPLISRLQMTVRNLDLRPIRPNAVLLLSGPAAERAAPLSEVIAETLFGSADRVVSIDFARFAHPADVSLLLGAPPGYIGYTDALPLHRVADLGWCVLLCTNLHACHPQVREVLTQALDSGYLTESRGRRIYLSDVIVVLTADVDMEDKGFGFVRQAPSPERVRQAAAAALGGGLLAQCSLVAVGAAAAAPDRRRWFVEHLTSELSPRFRSRGLELRWDDSVLDWLMEQSASGGPGDWERLLDDRLGAALVPLVPPASSGPPRPVMLRRAGDAIAVELLDPERSA